MKYILTIAIGFLYFCAYSQVANDDCFNASALGTLPNPANCGNGPNNDGQGDPVTFTNLTNVGSQTENPYSTLINCQGSGQDMASPATDVWFSFVPTGSSLDITITGNINEPNIGLWTGTCGNLIGAGCDIGSGGNLTTTIEQLTIGQTYYIQISGSDPSDEGTFDLTLQNNIGCGDCLLTSSMTVDPLPINGTYQAGTVVTFCFTVTEWGQTNTNWFHGVVPIMGNAWTNLTPLSAANTCDSGPGIWDWFTNVTTPLGNSNGFFFDGAIVGANVIPDGDPTNNYGDNCEGSGLDWEFCWEATVMDCPPGQVGDDLGVAVETYGDGETGNWIDLACDFDPVYLFSASLACCPAPLMTSIDVSCQGLSDGTATAEAQTSANPWDFEWQDDSGNVISTTNNSNNDFNSITNISAGTYTVIVTDANGCVSLNTVVVNETAPITTTFNAIADICEGGSISLPGTSTNGIPGSWSPGIDNTQTTTYTFTPDAGQCATTVDMTVVVNPVVTSTTDTTICDDQLPFTWNGLTFSSAGSQTSTLISVVTGCDSLATLNLTISNAVNGTDTQTACDSYTWIDGNTYNASNNTATFNITGGAANGCDSLVMLDLTINNAVSGTDTQTACGSYAWIDGNTYNASNTTATFNIVGGAANGCDSLVTLDLTINNVVGSTDTQTACGSYTWIDGNTYNASNTTATFNIAGGAANGCDSIVTLDLTINNAVSGTDTQTSCGSYTWVDGNTYNANNTTATFNIVGGAANGCDSLVTLNLTISDLTIDSLVSFDPSCNGFCDGYIVAYISGGTAPYSYQWMDSGGNPIGTDNDTLYNICAGDYSIQVTDAGGGLLTYFNEEFGVDGVSCTSQGTLANGYNSGSGGWSVNSTGVNDADANLWFVSTMEEGVGSGNCGTGCSVGGPGINRTLHISNPAIPVFGLQADQGAAYNAGGGCPVFYCVATDIRAESPAINLAGTAMTLTFDYIHLGDGIDQCEIMYFDGAVWNSLGILPNTSIGSCTGGQHTWSQYNWPIPLALNGLANFQIGFRWVNDDDGAGTDPSVAIDNIQISELGGGCPALGNISVSDPQPLNLSITDPPAQCSPNTVDLTDPSVTAGSDAGTLTYWTDATATSSLSTPSAVSSGNTYYIQLDASGCTSIQPVVVVINPIDDASFSMTPTCFGGNAVVSGSPGGSFSFNTAPGDAALIDATSGAITNGTLGTTYDVIYVTSGICPASSTQSVTASTDLSYTPSIVNENCGAGDGSIILTATGGDGGPYQYSITGSAPYNLTGSFTGLVAANYSISILDNSGCEMTGTENLSSSGAPTIDSLVSTNPSCSGSCDGYIVAYVSGGTAPYSYQWMDSGGNPIGTDNDTLFNVCAGDYTIEVTDAGGGGMVLNSNYDFENGTGGGCGCPTGFICNNDAGQVFDGVHPVWTLGNQGCISSTTNYTNSLGAHSGTGYMYFYAGGDNISNGQISFVGGETIDLCVWYAGPQGSGASGQNTANSHFSFGVDGTQVSPDVLVPTNTAWTQYCFTVTMTAGNHTFQVLSGGAAQYSLWFDDFTVSTQGIGCPAFGSGVLTDPSPVVLNITDPGAVCAPGTVDLTDPSVTAGSDAGTLTYWTDALATNVLSTPSAVVIPGTYYVQLTDLNGCNAIQAVSVTINLGPTFNLNGTDPSLCNGIDGSILIGGLIALTDYEVSYFDGTSTVGPVIMTSSNLGEILLNALGSGTYDVTIMNTSTGCTGTAVQTSLLNPGAPIINPQIDSTACDTYTLVDITGTNLSGNESYYTQANASGTPLNPGDVISTTQTIYIYDAIGACSNESSFTITINNTPELADPGAQQACESYNLPLITGNNLSGNENYYTDLQSNSGTVITGPITSSQIVYIYDATGSCSDEISFQVTINAIPSLISFTGGGTYCEGDAIGSIIAEVNGVADYTLDYTLDGNAFSVSSSNSSIDLGNTSGVYILTALNDNFCSILLGATQTITINSLPNMPNASADTNYCANAQPLDMQAYGSTGAYTWYSDASLTQIIGNGGTYSPDVILGSTTYYVTATENGCESGPEAIVIEFLDCSIIIPTAFTPDYDQVNDTWELANIDNIYPNNVVSVYNRWGNKVYESSKGAYNTMPWDGNYNGAELPVASYYYIIEYNDNSTENSVGIVSILKNKL